jgi:hypothetical protein
VVFWIGFFLAGTCAPVYSVAAAGPASGGKETPFFEKDILPIFQAKCLLCHGGQKQKAGLDMRSRTALLEGGETGPAISPGSAEKSLLWIKVAANKMPPGKEKLSEAEKVLVHAWLEGGARADARGPVEKESKDRQVTDADRRFWSFQPPRRPAVPRVKTRERVRNPIDAFILAGQEKKGLALSPEADRLTLLRRVTFDLTGLPPSPREIEAFLVDKSVNAYERLLDRLLASQRYGEHWGRHWLDLAGYADSEGILDADYVRTAAWRYRDYVIRAFNKDKPYDRFLKEQLAGDELTDYWTAYRKEKRLLPEVVEALTATGFLRCASDTSRPDFVTIKNAPGYYYQTLDDTIQIVASATLGLTVQCARCHSHKYDPIPQTEYYRLQAIFMSGYRPAQWVPQVQRRLLEATQAQEQEAKVHNAKVDAALAGLRRQLADLPRQFAQRLFEDRLARLPAAIRQDVRTALATAVGKRNEVQKYLAGKFEPELRPAPPLLPQILAASYPEYLRKKQHFEKEIQAEEGKRLNFPEIRAFYDLPGEAKTRLLRRGDYRNPGPEVSPGTLSVLATPRPFVYQAPPRNARTSGRRLAFAKWLTQLDHPLTARVLVNRLWLHHFGEGIVATVDNFGRTGKAPRHPELLDWLAGEFVRRGWSIKAMHRLILTSSAYRQQALLQPQQHAAARRVDPDNHLLWRQRVRRLSAEEMRDAVLSVANNLNSDMFGPPVPMLRQGEGEVTTPAGPTGRRRSIYLQVRRSQPLTMLQAFDQPVMEVNCTRRSRSTVASQALTLLNSDFMVQEAQAFAQRVQRESPAQPAAYALTLAFHRQATPAERQKLTAFLEKQTGRYLALRAGKGQPASGLQHQEARQLALTDLCHMLLSANEFAYVD